MDRVHARKIDQDTAVAGAAAARIVAAAPDRRQHAVFAGEIHRIDDIGGPAAACDDCGLLVEHAVPDQPRRVVAVIAGQYHFTTQARAQCCDRLI